MPRGRKEKKIGGVSSRDVSTDTGKDDREWFEGMDAHENLSQEVVSESEHGRMERREKVEVTGQHSMDVGETDERDMDIGMNDEDKVDEKESERVEQKATEVMVERKEQKEKEGEKIDRMCMMFQQMMNVMNGKLDEQADVSKKQYEEMREMRVQQAGLSVKQDETKNEMRESLKELKEEINVRFEENRCENDRKFDEIRREMHESKEKMTNMFNERMTEFEIKNESWKNETYKNLSEVNVERVETVKEELKSELRVQEERIKGIEIVEDQHYLELQSQIGLTDKKASEECLNLRNGLSFADAKMEEVVNEVRVREEWMRKLVQENDERIREQMKSEIMREKMSGQMIIGMGNDCSVKFDGNMNKIHPKVFIKGLMHKLRYIQDVQDGCELIKRNLIGDPLIWFTSKEDQIVDAKDFQEKFLKYYWGETQQAMARENLYFGKYRPNDRTTMSSYALQLYSIAKHLEPPMQESEIVLYVSRHFKDEVSEVVGVQNIQSLEQMMTYLQRMERTKKQEYRQGQRLHDRNENTQTTFRNREYNRTHEGGQNKFMGNYPNYNNNYNRNYNENRNTDYTRQNNYNQNTRNRNNENNNPRKYTNTFTRKPIYKYKHKESYNKNKTYRDMVNDQNRTRNQTNTNTQDDITMRNPRVNNIVVEKAMIHKPDYDQIELDKNF